MASPITVNTGKLRDPKTIRRRIRSKSIRNYRGRAGSSVTRAGKVSNRVNSIKSILLNNGNMLTSQLGDSNKTASEDILKILGISCVKDPMINHAGYSFIPTQTDTETVENPHKMEWDIYRYLPKEEIDMSAVLKDTGGSFYKLDEGVDDVVSNEINIFKKQSSMSYNLDEIVANIYHVNYGMPSTKNIRGLKKK